MKNTIIYRIRKSITILTVTLSLLASTMLPMTAQADSWSTYLFVDSDYRTITKSLKTNTWATESQIDNRREIIFYKVRITKTGRLSFKLSGNQPSIIISATLPRRKNNELIYSEGYTSIGKSGSIAVDKGTYYLHISNGRCKYNFSSAPSQKNYCMQRSQRLKANKTVKIYFTPKLNYSRWYKISIPNNKKITITLNDEEQSFTIYNSRRQRIETVEKGSQKKYCTSKKQPKGTYYIRMISDRSDYEYNGYMFGKYITMKWN